MIAFLLTSIATALIAREALRPKTRTTLKVVSPLETVRGVIESGETPDDLLLGDVYRDLIANNQIDLLEQFLVVYSDEELPSEKDPPREPPSSGDSSPSSDPVADLPRTSSPFPKIPDDDWNAFVAALKTEPVSFSTERHVGAFHQRRDKAVGNVDTYEGQYASLVTEIEGLRSRDDLTRRVGEVIEIDGVKHGISESGLLAVARAAGTHWEDWIDNAESRSKYAGTTRMFLAANNLF